jgi:hypothetical protein
MIPRIFIEPFVRIELKNKVATIDWSGGASVWGASWYYRGAMYERTEEKDKRDLENRERYPVRRVAALYCVMKTYTTADGQDISTFFRVCAIERSMEGSTAITLIVNNELFNCVAPGIK